MDDYVKVAEVFALVCFGVFFLAVTGTHLRRASASDREHKRTNDLSERAIEVRERELEFAKKIREEDRRREEWTYPDDGDDD